MKVQSKNITAGIVTPLIMISVSIMISACTADRPAPVNGYNIVWESPSQDVSGSMPCGGGDIGLNVWSENGDILFYISRSGTFDENNTFVKLGRVRMRFSPNPFEGTEFRQELVLEKGYVQINGKNNELEGEMRIWVDVHRPVIHAELDCNRDVEALVSYESWRHDDILMRRDESRENSYRWVPPDSLVKRRDEICFTRGGIQFYHRNLSPTVFDVTISQQGMDSVKHLMYNPLHNLTYGGFIRGQSLEPDGTHSGKYLNTEFMGWNLRSTTAAKNHELEIYLHTDRVEEMEYWKAGLLKTIADAETAGKKAFRETLMWWDGFWERSFIRVGSGDNDDSSTAWQVGRNYQLFRYMLGCNARGKWPTKFNGGLFTYDPVFIREDWRFTPDFRNWGGGTFTAQNQRLVYFPMLKSGDFDMMRPQFDFYLRSLKNAELRSRVYWDHNGACFTEQLENFGLPNCTEYSWERPPGKDPGMQHNLWLEYQWDTALEFCLMILQLEQYTGRDISEYLPLFESCLAFFDVHYRFLAWLRGEAELDSMGRLVLYPGSACETYKAANNATPTIAALQQVLTGLLELPGKYMDEDKRDHWAGMLQTIPPIPYREIEGHTLIAPAESWERIQNTEAPQLYPVYPWRIYGLGKAGLDTAINTWMYDPEVRAFRDHVSWKQYNIFAACMGLREEAAEESSKKLQDSGRRFPAFWGPGKDWVPDHNWGGSGMIGLQEMLLQANGEKIMLFPAWPEEWDVHFRLHAPQNTVVEARMANGNPELISISPESRRNDIVLMIDD